MTYSEFKDAAAHLTEAGYKHAQDLVSMGFPGPMAISEAEVFERALKQGANTKEAIYEKRSA